LTKTFYKDLLVCYNSGTIIGVFIDDKLYSCHIWTSKKKTNGTFVAVMSKLLKGLECYCGHVIGFAFCYEADLSIRKVKIKILMLDYNFS
jgi:hypothetical protein